MHCTFSTALILNSYIIGFKIHGKDAATVIAIKKKYPDVANLEKTIAKVL